MIWLRFAVEGACWGLILSLVFSICYWFHSL